MGILKPKTREGMQGLPNEPTRGSASEGSERIAGGVWLLVIPLLSPAQVGFASHSRGVYPDTRVTRDVRVRRSVFGYCVGRAIPRSV